MKKNTIIRIIIWSLVILLLVGIMLSVIAANSYNSSQQIRSAVLATIPSEAPQRTVTATATENVNIRTSPTMDARVGGMLAVGDTVDISQIMSVNGAPWAFIVSPQQGWVQTQYLDIQDSNPIAAETSPAETAAASVSRISELEIEWVGGTILVEAADVADIQISESEVSDSKYTMKIKRGDKKLKVDFCEEDLMERGFGLSIGEEWSKDLTILIPMDWTLDSLEVEAASANLTAKNLVIREVEFDGASGMCDFENCVVDQLDLDTASGDITFSGTLKVLDCDAASASVRATLDNVPSRIDMDSMSGDLELTLPENAGFTLDMKGMSSDFITDFGHSQHKTGTYTAGDGSCKINMDAMSGDVYIYKANNTAAIPESTPAESAANTEHHVHSDACYDNSDSCPYLSETHHSEG